MSIRAVRPFVRPFYERVPRGAAYCYSPLLATCKLRASVRRATAIVDRAKSVRLDRAPIPAVCSLHTCQARTHVQCYCKIM
jgi:hypothetical protein